MPFIDMPLNELYAYTGRNPKPADHDDYWRRSLEELAGIEAKLELIPAAFSAPSADCFDLWFTGVRGSRIHAKFLRPKQAAGRIPAVVQFHGYTESSGSWADKLAYVSSGFAVAALDCRGQGGLSEDRGGIKGNTFHGHFIRGIDSGPDDLLMRHIFLDAAQLAGIVMSMPDIDPGRVAAMGGSQGGALTVACAALEPRIAKLAPQYPFLSDYKRVWEMGLAEDAYEELRTYFRQSDPLHEREEETFRKLGYIDLQFLSSRIRGEVLMATGLMDSVCPPSTQFALYNRISAKKKVLLYPDFGHEALPGYDDRAYAFMMELR
jgi:cephalosporin-C deacetylase